MIFDPNLRQDPRSKYFFRLQVDIQWCDSFSKHSTALLFSWPLVSTQVLYWHKHVLGESQLGTDLAETEAPLPPKKGIFSAYVVLLSCLLHGSLTLVLDQGKM